MHFNHHLNSNGKREFKKNLYFSLIFIFLTISFIYRFIIIGCDCIHSHWSHSYTKCIRQMMEMVSLVFFIHAVSGRHFTRSSHIWYTYVRLVCMKWKGGDECWIYPYGIMMIWNPFLCSCDDSYVCMELCFLLLFGRAKNFPQNHFFYSIFFCHRKTQICTFRAMDVMCCAVLVLVHRTFGEWKRTDNSTLIWKMTACNPAVNIIPVYLFTQSDCNWFYFCCCCGFNCAMGASTRR